MERYDIIKEKWEILQLLPVERNDIIVKKWESLMRRQSAEDDEDEDKDKEEEDEEEDDYHDYTFKKISAIVSNGRIIAYGMISKAQNDDFERDDNEDDESDNDEQIPFLMVYHPGKNEWKIVNKEEKTGVNLQPMLFKHKGRCYKILYIPEEEATLFHSCHLPSVHALDIKAGDDGAFSASVGEELQQSDLPHGAFRINGEVFMIRNGLAYKTDAKIRPL